MSSDNKERIKKSSEEWFDLIGTGLTWVLMMAVFCALPLFLRNKYDHIAAGKYFFLFETGRWTAVVMGLFAAAYYAGRGLSAAELKARKRIRLVDLSVLAYTVITAISFFFSKYRFVENSLEDEWKEGALWGSSGWYMGLLTYLIMILFYVVMSRFFLYTDRFLIPAFFSAEIVFLWGMLNRFRFSVFKFDGEDPKFLASIGNINWFMGYASVIVPLMMGLYWYRGYRNRLMYGSLLFTGFMTVIVNGSDSGVLALFLTMLFLFAYSLKDEDKIRTFAEMALIFAGGDFLIAAIIKVYKHFLSFEGMLTKILTDIRVASIILFASVGFFFYLYYLKKKEKIYPPFLRDTFGKLVCVLTAAFFGAIILLIVINTKSGGKIPVIGKHEFFMFNREWGTLRGTDWEAAIRLFIAQSPFGKLFGSGPDTFWFLAMDHPDVLAIIKENFHNTRLTNAHCEIFTVLINQGLLGLAAYLAISVSMFAALFKRLKDNPRYMMFILVIIMYHANNLISFEQITSTPFFYMVLGISAAALLRPQVDKQSGR
ncbi:MAG: O-antigen ligase family protein [Lachnospiraceae bacterium]|nr:O-antigen ligase family protein [Lachnospiraceae bacterium]